MKGGGGRRDGRERGVVDMRTHTCTHKFSIQSQRVHETAQAVWVWLEGGHLDIVMATKTVSETSRENAHTHPHRRLCAVYIFHFLQTLFASLRPTHRCRENNTQKSQTHEEREHTSLTTPRGGAERRKMRDMLCSQCGGSWCSWKNIISGWKEKGKRANPEMYRRSAHCMAWCGLKEKAIENRKMVSHCAFDTSIQDTTSRLSGGRRYSEVSDVTVWMLKPIWVRSRASGLGGG